MIRIKQKGDWKCTDRFLKHALKRPYRNILDKYGKEGVQALSSATPVDSGETAMAWQYKIEPHANGYRIVWSNAHIENGSFQVALMLQYGHGTGTGGWVQGIDYINPAIRPIFEKMANDAWGEVRKG